MPQLLSVKQIETALQLEAQGQAPPEIMSWLREQGELPSTGLAQKQKPVTPGVTPPPQPLGAMAAGAVGAGKFIKETALDPETVGATVGSVLSASRSTPQGMMFAGTGAAIPAAIRELYQSQQETPPRRPSVAPIAEAFASGALGEGGARMIFGAGRPKADFAGREAVEFYGKENVGAHQMKQNPALDVAGNIASYGAGGRKTMEDAAKKRSDMLLKHMEGVSQDLAPTGNLSAHTISPSGIDRAQPGLAVQKNLKGNLDEMKATSGFKEFMEKYGGLAKEAAEGEAESPTLRQLQERRSALLAQSRGRPGTPEAARAVQEAAAIEQEMRGLLDPAGQTEWDRITDFYKQGKRRLDNPTVRTIREDTPGDTVIDKVLGRQLKGYAPLETGIALSNDEKVAALRKALTPDAWQQFQGDTLNELMHSAIDEKTGRLSFKALEQLWMYPKTGLSDKVKKDLFGKALPEVNRAIRLLKLEEPRTEAGRLFIAIRQPGAAIAGGAAAMGVMSGNLDKTSAVMGAGAVILAPYALAKLLNSPAGRKLLVNFATATPVRQKALAQAIIRFGSQMATEETREEVQPMSQSKPISLNSSVPTPPGR